MSVLPKESLVQKSDGESSEMNRRSGRNDRFHSCFFLPVSRENATNREFDTFYLSEKERNMQERMKKAVSVILVILMLGPAYGAMASGEPLFHTIREALDTSEGLAQIDETDDEPIIITLENGLFTCAFETERTGYDDMENLRVTSGKFYGFSRAAFDLTCHADGCF